jgi:hypothetical protein
MTGKAHTAVHSPINWDLGGVPPEVGGWAVKTRHSWGRAQTCERCHTDASVFVDAPSRQGKFVGAWAAGQRQAAFVGERRVRSIVFDPKALQHSPHAGIACLECHSRSGEVACTGCHPAGPGLDRRRALFEHTASSLRESREVLRRAAGALDPSWQQRWDALWDHYEGAAHDFHETPAAAQQQVAAIRQAAAVYAVELRGAAGRPRP